MKNFLIEKLGGYTKDEMVKGIEYTIESVNELLEGKDVQYEIKSRDLHFEGRAVAGEIGITNCERVSLGSLIKEAKAKLEEIMKSEPAPKRKPSNKNLTINPASNMNGRVVIKKPIAKKTSTNRKAIMKSNITKSN
jgi:hypothetical protein